MVVADKTRIRPVTATGNIKTPKTSWEMGERDGEIHQVTTVTLVLVDLPEHEIRRLARSAAEKVKVAIDITPEIDQGEFSL